MKTKATILCWMAYPGAGIMHAWKWTDTEFVDTICGVSAERGLLKLGPTLAVMSADGIETTPMGVFCGVCKTRINDYYVDDVVPSTQHPRILNDAINVVYEDREKTRGHPRPGYELLSRLWGAYLGMDLSIDKTIHMLTMLKIARDTMVPEHDNLVDIAGYAENLARCRE